MKSLFSRLGWLFSKAWWLLDGTRRALMNLLVLLLLVALVSALLFHGPKPLADKTTLVLKLEGNLVEQFSGSAREQLVAQAQGPGWSERFATEFAGQPVKPVALEAEGFPRRQGEFVITATGIEGSLVYAASAVLRDRILRDGSATLHLDLLPQLPPERVLAEVKHPRGSRSLSSHLKSRLHLGPLKLGLLHELLTREQMLDATTLAVALKALPLTLQNPRPVAEAISTAGGVRFEALTDGLMLKALPGVFCAGEMLDWEAPTGGYLLTASLASGRRAAQGLRAWLAGHG